MFKKLIAALLISAFGLLSISTPAAASSTPGVPKHKFVKLQVGGCLPYYVWMFGKFWWCRNFGPCPGYCFIKCIGHEGLFSDGPHACECFVDEATGGRIPGSFALGKLESSVEYLPTTSSFVVRVPSHVIRLIDKNQIEQNVEMNRLAFSISPLPWADYPVGPDQKLVYISNAGASMSSYLNSTVTEYTGENRFELNPSVHAYLNEPVAGQLPINVGILNTTTGEFSFGIYFTIYNEITKIKEVAVFDVTGSLKEGKAEIDYNFKIYGNYN